MKRQGQVLLKVCLALLIAALARSVHHSTSLPTAALVRGLTERGSRSRIGFADSAEHRHWEVYEETADDYKRTIVSPTSRKEVRVLAAWYNKPYVTILLLSPCGQPS